MEIKSCCWRYIYPKYYITQYGDRVSAQVLSECAYEEVGGKINCKAFPKIIGLEDNMKKVICFHNPDENNGYLSNWYLSDFKWNEQVFTSMEQYMMYRKASVFGDTEIANEIMTVSDVGKIKALGRSVKNYDDIIWNGMRQIVIYEGLLEKFRQNDELKERLLVTQDHILAECAVQDKIWGIGLSMKDERRVDLEQWEGQNLLGFSLMMVRDTLRKEYK